MSHKCLLMALNADSTLISIYSGKQNIFSQTLHMKIVIEKAGHVRDR